MLNAWLAFYEITGSAAGALTGLQFVVITLLARNESAGSMHELRAFGTPTVVHFCVALLLSATMSAPWPSLAWLSGCLITYAVIGLVYSMRVLVHSRRAKYAPDAGDRFWYLALPLVNYTAVLAAAVLLSWSAPAGLFMVAAVDLAFLFNGTHNSWDTVTYLVIGQREKEE